MLRRAHEGLVVHAVGRELRRGARPPDPAGAREHLEQVVEAGRCLVDDVAGPHHELRVAGLLVEEAEVAVVFDPGVVEVREVAAVVDDPLGIRVGEADPRVRREIEGRLPGRGLAQVHAAMLVGGLPGEAPG